MDITIPTDFGEFLQWIGSPVFVGITLSMIAERLGSFQGWSAEVKQAVMLGVSIGLPLVSKILLEALPPEAVETITPWWTVIVAGFTVWMGSQAFHVVRKAVKKRLE